MKSPFSVGTETGKRKWVQATDVKLDIWFSSGFPHEKMLTLTKTTTSSFGEFHKQIKLLLWHHASQCEDYMHTRVTVCLQSVLVCFCPAGSFKCTRYSIKGSLSAKSQDQQQRGWFMSSDGKQSKPTVSRLFRQQSCEIIIMSWCIINTWCTQGVIYPELPWVGYCFIFTHKCKYIHI